MRPLAFAASLAIVAASVVHGGLITSVPGPDDQGGMVMPQIFITGTDDPYEPTYGTLGVSFDPAPPPVMDGLQHWSPGDWFARDAAWRADLGSPAGFGGTLPDNAGRGELFNCQYGFTFLADPELGAAFVPSGKCLAIRLVALSSSDLRAFNYDDFDNVWDEVLGPAIRPRVLWNGSMWHNYYTLPADAPPGLYTATYEAFVADGEFTPGTGFVDYSPAALAAAADPRFIPATITYTWIVPGPPRAFVRLTDGVPVVSIASRTGRDYQLQLRDNFTGSWTNNGSVRPGTGGWLEFIDSTSPRPKARFYRIEERH